MVMRFMVTSKRLAVSLMALVSFLVLPGGALAARPVTFQVDDVIVDQFLTGACGFEVVDVVTGTIRVSENSENLFLARFSLKHTLTGPGGSLSFPDVGIDKLLTVADDGVTRVETVMATGVLGFRIVVPGQGVVAGNTGREIRIFTFDAETGEPLGFDLDIDSGLDRPLEGAALEAVCATLSG
jgi:hypothetical protein